MSSTVRCWDSLLLLLQVLSVTTAVLRYQEIPLDTTSTVTALRDAHPLFKLTTPKPLPSAKGLQVSINLQGEKMMNSIDHNLNAQHQPTPRLLHETFNPTSLATPKQEPVKIFGWKEGIIHDLKPVLPATPTQHATQVIPVVPTQTPRVTTTTTTVPPSVLRPMSRTITPSSRRGEERQLEIHNVQVASIAKQLTRKQQDQDSPRVQVASISRLDEHESMRLKSILMKKISMMQEIKESNPTMTAEELFRRQAQEANFSFSSMVKDGLSDLHQSRQETRESGAVVGSYSFSDGFFRRTVQYRADDMGYRVLSEKVEPLGGGPMPNPDGTAEVAIESSSGVKSNYVISSADLQKSKMDSPLMGIEPRIIA